MNDKQNCGQPMYAALGQCTNVAMQQLTHTTLQVLSSAPTGIQAHHNVGNVQCSMYNTQVNATDQADQRMQDQLGSTKGVLLDALDHTATIASFPSSSAVNDRELRYQCDWGSNHTGIGSLSTSSTTSRFPSKALPVFPPNPSCSTSSCSGAYPDVEPRPDGCVPTLPPLGPGPRA